MAGNTFDFVETGMSPRARRRARVLVFLGVFLLVATVGLFWDYSRPAEYRAGARVEIFVPPEATAGAGEANRPTFLGEVQRLTSRPIAEKALARIREDARPADTADPVAALLAMLTVEAVEGTRIVQLWATGPQADVLPVTLHSLVDAYEDDIAQRYKSDTGEALAKAEDEAKRLEAAVAVKRKQVEDFRTRHEIVSLERDENQALSELKGQSSALNAAEEKLVNAEGKLRAIKEATAAGSAPVRAKDNPTLANLEQRASQLREELKNLEKQFTRAYLDLDPNVVARRTRLAELEAQISVQRQDSQQASLAEAEQDVAASRNAVDRLRQTMASQRGTVQAFAARMGEYKTLTEQLAGLETMRRTAAEHALKLRSSVQVRAPSIKLIESAALPREPWRPLYERDAAIALGIALASALIALLIFDYVTRRDPIPTVVVAGSPPMPTLSFDQLDRLGVASQPQLGAAARAQLGPSAHAQIGRQPGNAALAGNGSPPLLGSVAELPRELEGNEIDAILAAADRRTAVALALLLSGPSPDEAIAARWGDVDLERGILRIGGPGARELQLEPALAAILAAARAEANPAPTDPVLRDVAGGPIDASGLEVAVACAAHDAQLADAQSVTASSLAHTYTAFLVRQGIRFAELGRLVGGLSPGQLTAYMALAPAGARVGLDRVVRTLPAVATYAGRQATVGGVAPGVDATRAA